MRGNPAEEQLRAKLVAQIGRWLEQSDGTVAHAEEVERRWAVRIRQEVRDATTIWFDVGSRSIWFEAYVLPAPPGDLLEVYRQALIRNQRSWRAFFALDAEGAVVLRGRLAASPSLPDDLDRALAEIYEAVEIAFPAMVAAGFSKREKTD